MSFNVPHNAYIHSKKGMTANTQLHYVASVSQVVEEYIVCAQRKY